jgi:hypothetical protein
LAKAAPTASTWSHSNSWENISPQQDWNSARRSAPGLKKMPVLFDRL